jgi:hypothetical protein
MHRREDYPESQPDGGRRLQVGGLDRIWTRFQGDAERSWVPL